MIRHRYWFLLCGLVIVSSPPAFAQNSGSEADQEACTPDVFRLCQDFIPNEAPIVACLESKRRQLSPACLRVMFPPPPPSASARPPHRVRHRYRKPPPT